MSYFREELIAMLLKKMGSSITIARLATAITFAILVVGCSNSPGGKVLTCYTPGEEETLYKIEVVSEYRWYYSNRSGSWTTNLGRRSYTPPGNTVCTTEEMEL